MCPVSMQNNGYRLARCLQHDTWVKEDCNFKASKNGGTFSPAFETPYAYSMTLGFRKIPFKMEIYCPCL